MGCYERRSEIVRLLKTGKRLTLREMSERFDVTKRTILNDMNRLPPDFPVAIEYGRNGGYFYTGKKDAVLNATESEAVCRLVEAHRAEMAEDVAQTVLQKLRKQSDEGADG